MQTTLQSLATIAFRFRSARRWRQFHHPKNMAMDLAVESAEVLEHFLWRDGKELEQHLADPARKAAIADELGDVLHALLLLAADLKIDLPAAFKRKMAKNAVKYPVAKSRGSARKYTEL